MNENNHTVPPNNKINCIQKFPKRIRIILIRIEVSVKMSKQPTFFLSQCHISQMPQKLSCGTVVEMSSDVVPYSTADLKLLVVTNTNTNVIPY